MKALLLAFGAWLALVVLACGSGSNGDADADGKGTDSDLPTIIGADARGDNGGPSDSTPLPDSGDATQAPQDAGDSNPMSCKEKDRLCLSDKEIAECQLGKWVVVSVCDTQTHFCAGGTCVLKEACTPGEIKGCYSLTALKQCNLDGTGYIPFNCPEGQACANGKCGTFDCLPGKSVCLDNGTKQICNDNGEWDPPTPCPQGLLCVGGKCLSQCLSDPKWNNSYIGCEYWSVDLDNYPDPFSPTQPDEAIHGLILGNPGTAAAEVIFTSFASDVVFDVQPVQIPAGQVAIVPLPRADIDGPVISDRSVKINSNRPIVAYQFNPLDFQKTFSDDSSLLIPAEMLGKEYLILSYPTTPLEAMPIGSMPSQHGYFTVVAVEPGPTNLSVQLTAKVEKPAGAKGEYLQPGPVHSFKLEQGQVINFQATGTQLFPLMDLSGSHVTADRKIAVFSGHEEAVVQFPDNAELDCCCAEHLEEQLFPLDTWDSTYVCAHVKPRGGYDHDLWRVQAGSSNISLTTDPPIDGIHGKTLTKKGDWVEAYTQASFVIQATGPIQVAQYMSSQTCTDDAIGDPSLIMAVSSSQYRSNYVIAAPKDYDEDYITVIKPAGGAVSLDGGALSQTEFKSVGGGEFEVGYFEIQDGPHVVEGDQPFGLYQYGWDGPASYGNPGGLNLIKKDIGE
jgi:hypothetical protein